MKMHHLTVLSDKTVLILEIHTKKSRVTNQKWQTYVTTHEAGTVWWIKKIKTKTYVALTLCSSERFHRGGKIGQSLALCPVFSHMLWQWSQWGLEAGIRSIDSAALSAAPLLAGLWVGGDCLASPFQAGSSSESQNAQGTKKIRVDRKSLDRALPILYYLINVLNV